MTTQGRSWIIAALGALLLAAPALAQPMAGVCRLESIVQDPLAPIDDVGPFVANVALPSIAVTIDPATGAMTADFGALPPLTFPNGFSQDSLLDTIDFTGAPVSGTMYADGTIFLADVRGTNCTQGKCPSGPPCPCVPGNLCSNDLERVCLPGVTGDLACDGGGVCQGVCSNDLTRSCAVSGDCDPPGFCGEGIGMRVDVNLTTGASSFLDFVRVGSADGAFTSGSVTLIDVTQTPVETFAIGDGGVTSLRVGCQLDPIPAAAGLPAAPTWEPKKGLVKLGKGGQGEGDDALKLKGFFTPSGGEADFDADDMTIALVGDGGSRTLRVPAGAMAANAKGTKWKLKDKEGSVVDVAPPPPPAAGTSHVVTVKRKRDGRHLVVLSSKGLDLNALAGDTMLSAILVATQRPSESEPIKTNKKGNKLKF